MKKSIFLRYLLFIIFFIFISCRKDSNPLNNSLECQDQICEVNIDDFIIKLSVYMIPYNNEDFDSILDSENYLGVLQGATDSYDTDYDILDPPVGVGNWIRLYFPHPEWEHNLGDNFTQDIRGNILLDQENRTIQWDFNIESNASGTINLNFELLDSYCYNCIESIQLILNDEVYNSSSLDIDNLNISTFLQSNQIISFKLIYDFLDSN